jgi:hypothetical protein
VEGNDDDDVEAQRLEAELEQTRQLLAQRKEEYPEEFEAVEESERKLRDAKALLLVAKVIATAKEVLRREDLLLNYGEEIEDYWTKLKELKDSRPDEELKELARVMEFLERGRMVAQPVTQWTGKFAKYGPHATEVPEYEEPENCDTWDLYFVSYSMVLRSVVVTAVIRNQTTAQCRRIGFTGVFKKA